MAALKQFKKVISYEYINNVKVYCIFDGYVLKGQPISINLN